MITNPHVLVMGATGAVGAEFVRQCVADPRIARVTALSRRPLNISHPKLDVIVREDFLNYADLTDVFSKIDICYCALGVSQVQVRDPKLYTEITRDHVVNAARALKQASPDMRFCFVSGMGADTSEKNSVLWRRVKGETENRLRELLGDKLLIARPAYIHPIHPREHVQWQDKIYSLFYVLKPVMRTLVTDTVEVSRAMINASVARDIPRILNNRDLKTWAK